MFLLAICHNYVQYLNSCRNYFSPVSVENTKSRLQLWLTWTVLWDHVSLTIVLFQLLVEWAWKEFSQCNQVSRLISSLSHALEIQPSLHTILDHDMVLYDTLKSDLIRGLTYGFRLSLRTNLSHMRIEDTDDTVSMHSLVLAMAARLFDSMN